MQTLNDATLVVSLAAVPPTALTRDADGPAVAMIVDDEGPAMASAEISTAFWPF